MRSVITGHRSAATLARVLVFAAQRGLNLNPLSIPLAALFNPQFWIFLCIAAARWGTLAELGGPLRERLLETGRAFWRYRVGLHDAALRALTAVP